MTQPFFKNKKVLVTGGTGFIGSNLSKKLVHMGATVTIFDNSNPSSGANMYNIAPFKKDIYLLNGDLLHYDQIVEAVRNQEFIFNCAASTSHPFSMREPLSDLDVNGRGMIHLLEAIRRFNNKAKLIHIGTTTQTGELKYKPADELHPEFPTDVYSASKSLSENYALIYGRSYSTPVVVIRFPNVYGPRACINSSEFNFVNYFIGLALQNKAVTVFGEGSQLRNVLYIDDAVSALIKAAQEEKASGEVFIASSDEHLSVKAIAKTIVATFDSGKVNIVRWPKNRKAIEVGDAVFNNNKIKEILGWQAKTTFLTGLKKTQTFYKNKLKEYI